MKIVLIGFMGSGKSTIAPLLAKRLGMEAVEMDDLVIQKADDKSISEIFTASGENLFRELEATVAHELRDRKQTVISTGGGVVINDALMAALTHNAVAVVHLDTTFDKARERVGADIAGRPLFADARKARALYGSRQPLYSKYATVRVDMDTQTTEQAVQAIIDELEIKNS